MTGSDSAAVKAAIASRLLKLVPLAGVSSRLTGLAVALERLGSADDKLRSLSEEIGDNTERLDSVFGAILHWGYEKPNDLSFEDRSALFYAATLIQIKSQECAMINRIEKEQTP